MREYPDTDVPTVSVSTIYRGASAEVVESRVTEPLEEQLAAIDGIRVMKSSSYEEASVITIEFLLERDPDEAANDVRDRVSRARDQLPDEVDEPIIAKEDADAQPVIWMTFTSDRFTRTELTDLVKAAQKQAEANGILGHGLHQPFETMFEDVFEEMPWHLKEQCAQMLEEQHRKFGPEWEPK